MLRRAALSFSSVALAVALLLNFQGPPPAPTATISGDPSKRVASAAGGTIGSTATRAPASPRPAASPNASAGAATTGGSSAAATIKGDLVSTPYGDVQVEITIANGKITDVRALALPTGGRSGLISNFVEPTLRSQALSVQSAAIDGVSGATYTSRGYAASLQSALDAAGR